MKRSPLRKSIAVVLGGQKTPPTSPKKSEEGTSKRKLKLSRKKAAEEASSSKLSPRSKKAGLLMETIAYEDDVPYFFSGELGEDSVSFDHDETAANNVDTVAIAEMSMTNLFQQSIRLLEDLYFDEKDNNKNNNHKRDETI